MMKALSFNQSQAISYEITHDHLSQFLYAHDFHDGTIKCLRHPTTPTKNLASGCTTSTIHQSPFGGVNQWDMRAAALTFTPSPYISLQADTSTPIYTMEVRSFSRSIEKFNKRPSTISLKEFNATFSIVVCELELKYGVNYIEVFTIKQLARYVHYEALNVYEQHFLKILGVLQIPNPAYATANAISIATTSQVALQATIEHYGTVPNNPDLIPTLIKFSPQQFIVVTANIPHTIDAPAFTNPVGEFF
jgi:hypothetical protein